MASADTLITIRDVAARLNTTERHVRSLVHRNAIPYLKVGRLVRFDPVDVDAWLEDNRQAPELSA